MIEKIFSKTPYYVIVIGFIVLYLLYESKVLNFPYYIDIILFIVAFISVFYIAYKYDSRKRKDITEYEKDIKEKKDVNVFAAPLLNLIGVCILSIAITCAIKLPLLYYVEFSAKNNPIKTIEVSIDKVKLRKTSTLYINFNGVSEKLNFDNNNIRNIGRERLLSDYVVSLNYRGSVWGMYVISHYELKKKDS